MGASGNGGDSGDGSAGTARDLIPFLNRMQGQMNSMQGQLNSMQDQMQGQLNDMQGQLNGIQGQLNGISQTLNPFANPALQNTRLVTPDDLNGQLLTNDKNGVYTWMNFPSNPSPVAIGSAHTSLRYHTLSVLPPPQPGRFEIFVALPQAVLESGVKSVRFVDTEQFQNPLPTCLDVCVVDLEETPKNKDGVASFTTVPGGTKSFTNSNVVGKSNGSFVASFGGAVVVQKHTTTGLGKVEFLLQAGDPEDSGTLLHVKDADGCFHPIAIFSGVSRPSASHQRRGHGCLIPEAKNFQSRLSVMNPTDVQYVFLASQGGAAKFRVEGKPKKAVVLKQENGSAELHGVFVTSPTPITYMGDSDIARMSNLGMSDRMNENPFMT